MLISSFKTNFADDPTKSENQFKNIDIFRLFLSVFYLILIVIFYVAVPYFIEPEKDRIVNKNKEFQIEYYFTITLIFVIAFSFLKDRDEEPIFIMKDIINKTSETIILTYGRVILSIVIFILLLLMSLYESGHNPIQSEHKNGILLFIPIITIFFILYVREPNIISNVLYHCLIGTIITIIYGFSIFLFVIFKLPYYIYEKFQDFFQELFQKIKDVIFDYIINPVILLYKSINKKIKEDEVIRTEFNKQLRKTAVFSIFIAFIFCVIVYAKFDNRSTDNMMYFYTFLVIIPLIIGLYVSSLLVTENEIPLHYKVIFFVSVLLTFGGAYCYSNQLTPTNNIYIYSIGNILLYLIIIIFLGIFFIIFSNYLKRQKGILGFIINLIFFIPCLFTDFIQFIKTQIGLTPNIAYIMLLLEFIVILSYIYLPESIKYLLHKNSVKLQNTPYYLNQEYTIAIDKVFQSTTLYNTDKDDNYVNNNYAFSFWVYLNANEVYSKDNDGLGKKNEINIFDFAKGIPKVVYVNDEVNNDTWRIYLSNNCNKKIGLSSCDVNKYSKDFIELNGLPKQRWNLFVINYTGNSADLFINGELRGSIIFVDNNIPVSIQDGDKVVVGQKTNGLNGAIKESYYYNRSLSKFEIVNMYNIFNTFGTN
jgi:hypothetical protein